MRRNFPSLVVVGLLVSASILGGCTGTAPLPPKAIELNRAGIEALAAGELDVADARLALAIEYNPHFTEAWVNAGIVALRRGNFDLAEKHFARARRLNPDLPAPHHALGLLADTRGRGTEAEKHYRAALAVDPGFAAARLNLARRLFERNAIDESQEQFLRLTEVAPNELRGWLGRIECLVRLGRNDDADDQLVRARLRFGSEPEIQLLEARRLLRHGAVGDAETAFEALAHDSVESRATKAWAWLAVARASRSDSNGAKQAANEALRRDKNEPVARFVIQLIGAN